VVARVQYAFHVSQGSVATLFSWGGKRLLSYCSKCILETVYQTRKSPDWSSKTQNDNFSSKIDICRKKVWYRVSLWYKLPAANCNAFTTLTIGAQMVGGSRTLLHENFRQNGLPSANTQTFNRYSIAASQP